MKHRLTLTAAILFASVGPVAADPPFQLIPRVSTEVIVEQLFVRHFASNADFGLGSPVSILDYDPFVSAGVSLGGTLTTAAGPWLDFELSSNMLGGGTLIDSDFSAGTLVSQTLSAASLQSNLGLTIRGWYAPATTFGSVAIQPFVGVSLTERELIARGLRCGTVCAVAPLADATLVMQHSLFDGQVEVGARGTIGLTDGLSLAAEVQVGVGKAYLADSHVLRTDLGPTPNIESDFLTIDGKARLGPVWTLAPNTTLAIQVQVAGMYGVGTTIFGPASTSPSASLPSDIVDVEGGLLIALKGPLP